MLQNGWRSTRINLKCNKKTTNSHKFSTIFCFYLARTIEIKRKIRGSLKIRIRNRTQFNVSFVFEWKSVRIALKNSESLHKIHTNLCILLSMVFWSEITKDSCNFFLLWFLNISKLVLRVNHSPWTKCHIIAEKCISVSCFILSFHTLHPTHTFPVCSSNILVPWFLLVLWIEFIGFSLFLPFPQSRSCFLPLSLPTLAVYFTTHFCQVSSFPKFSAWENKFTNVVVEIKSKFLRFPRLALLWNPFEPLRERQKLFFSHSQGKGYANAFASFPLNPLETIQNESPREGAECSKLNGNISRVGKVQVCIKVYIFWRVFAWVQMDFLVVSSGKQITFEQFLERRKIKEKVSQSSANWKLKKFAEIFHFFTAFSLKNSPNSW